MDGDERSFRVALMADRFVNPPPGGLDGLALAEETGWGVLQLPSDDYPPDIAGPMATEVAEHAEEFVRRGYDVVLVGAPGALAAALAELNMPLPDRCEPSGADELRRFLCGRPAPPASRLLS